MQLRGTTIEEAQHRGMSYILQVHSEMRQEISELLFLDNVNTKLSPMLKQRLENLKALWTGMKTEIDNMNAMLADLEIFVNNCDIEDEAIRRDNASNG